MTCYDPYLEDKKPIVCLRVDGENVCSSILVISALVWKDFCGFKGVFLV